MCFLLCTGECNPKFLVLYRYKMTINVNNQPQSVPEHSTIEKVVEQLDISATGIAIAINNEIVSKNNWNTTVLKEKDQVVIIKATQGG